MSQPAIRAVIAPVTPLQQNCTLVWCAKTMKAAIIDPGGEVPRLMGALDQYGLTLEKIWITHGHLDHAGATAQLKALTGAVIEGPHRDDAPLIAGIPESGARFGMPDARSARFAQVGDVLFQGSIGRTDFPGGSYPQLIAAITGKLWPLGEDVAFVPGHGPMSTFGRERQTNPFVSDEALAEG